MSILPKFRWPLFDDLVVVCECRRCGTNVDSESTPCPTCGNAGIARYEIG